MRMGPIYAKCLSGSAALVRATARGARHDSPSNRAVGTTPSVRKLFRGWTPVGLASRHPFGRPTIPTPHMRGPRRNDESGPKLLRMGQSLWLSGALAVAEALHAKAARPRKITCTSFPFVVSKTEQTLVSPRRRRYVSVRTSGLSDGIIRSRCGKELPSGFLRYSAYCFFASDPGRPLA